MTPRLVRPVRPPTPFDATLEREWAEFSADALTQVRKSAENWRTGLAAILGLVSLFAVVQAPRATKDLEKWPAWLAGGCLVVAVLAAVIGAAAALRAAYGVPRKMTRDSFLGGGGRNGLALRQALAARTDLRLARWMTYLAMALLTVAVAVTWIAPAASDGLAKIKTTNGVVLCGTLASSGDGQLQLDSKTAGTRLLRLADLASIDLVASCDE